MKRLGITIVCAGLAVVGFIYFMMSVHYTNKEKSVRNLIVAQQKNIQLVYDNTWKIIKQKAQVADKYENAFKEIYPKLMENRYGDDNTLMKWITESNPELSTDLYKSLSNSIEAQRVNFTREQSELVAIKKEHDDLIDKWPASHFNRNVSKIEIKTITSTKTEKAFDSGKDDDIEVF